MPILQWLFSENACLAVVFFAAAAGLTVALATSPRNVRIAHWFFAIAFIWSAACSARWLAYSEMTMKYPIAFLLGGTILCLWVASYRWVEANHIEQGGSSAGSQEPKKPDIQQGSQGANSPNTTVIGNNNTVINNSDPKVSAKLDEIKKLLQTQQGDRATPDKLLKKYPLGYALFDFDRSNRVFPYATEALLSRWGFDWSSVAVRESKIDGQDVTWVTLPNMFGKGGNFKNISIGGPKKVGPLNGIALRTDDFDLRVEILAISPKGIVFLLGFDRPH